jgi:hypothetical protein
MKLKKIDDAQRLEWYVASLVYGIFVTYTATDSGFFMEGDSNWFPISVFVTSWLIGVVGIRLYLQQYAVRKSKSGRPGQS